MITHKFIDQIPPNLDENVLYISIQFSTAIHKCPCGCKNEVVTPFSPTDWTLIFNGESVSLSPSIGNWNFPCKSHYWIKENKIIWSKQWSPEKIALGRKNNIDKKFIYYDKRKTKRFSLWQNVKDFFK